MSRLDASALAEQIRNETRDGLRRVVEEHILGVTSQVFDATPQLYADVCSHVGKELGVPATEVHLVGSAQVDYSLAPAAFPRAFHSGSDLDFAITSEHLFDAAWDTFRHWAYPRRHNLPADELRWFNARSSEVFWGWLNPHALKFKGLQFPRDLEPLRNLSTKWFETFRALGTAFPGTEVAGRDASARLYRSKRHLIDYQAEGLRRLQYQLQKSRGI